MGCSRQGTPADLYLCQVQTPAGCEVKYLEEGRGWYSNDIWWLIYSDISLIQIGMNRRKHRKSIRNEYPKVSPGLIYLDSLLIKT